MLASKSRKDAVQSVKKAKQGALRMNLLVRLFRGLGLVGLVLGGIVFSIAVASVATADFAFAQSSSAIQVEGNRRVEADTIRSYFRVGPGERLDAHKIDEALKSLYATGLFQDVKITPAAGGRVMVTVVENPVLNRVAFEGNKKVKDEQLNNEVQSKPRGTLSRPQVQADVQRIVEIYRRNGRFDVTVNPKIIEQPNNRVDLVFEINEGEKTGVKKIIFVGNQTFGDQRLKDEIKTAQTMPIFGFLQTTDIYDPDRIEADRDLMRRFYLKKGFADVRVVSAMSEYDPAQKGFIVTFTIEEGQRYRFGTVDIQSSVAAIDGKSLFGGVKTSAGALYNAEAIEKTVENLSIEVARRGYPFAIVRPSGDRDVAGAKVNVIYMVSEGPRVYIERINVRGNTRTRDYVIRREFDIAEGDAYNRALIDRAERRLKNLNFFKTVKINNEPGSASDRIVINVDVEEQPTGELSISGGYSTADGFMGEISVGERNLLGQGQYAKATLQYGQRVRGFELSYAEPYFLGYRLVGGIDLYAKQQLASNYYSYDSQSVGIGTRLGFAISEEFSTQLRYNIYQQKITLPDNLNNCQYSPNATVNGGGGVNPNSEAALAALGGFNCYSDGEASLPVRKELSQGAVTVSMVGYTLAYNTLDNNRTPTSGFLATFTQDFAGVGGDVNFVRSSVESRSYYEMFADVISVLHLQAGQISPWGGKDLRMLDHFQRGPELVRGFAPAGIGPRDLTPGTANDAMGGNDVLGARASKRRRRSR